MPRLRLPFGEDRAGSLPRRFPETVRPWGSFSFALALRARSLGKEEKLNRKEKEAAIARLKENFARAKAAVVTRYQGMTVQELGELRLSLSKVGVQYKVVKNTLARIAAEGTPVAPAREHLKGPVGIALGFDDAIAAAKGIIGFAGKNEKLKPMAAVIDGEFLLAGELKAVSELPPRQVLLGMMAGVMAAPLSKMAGALSATVGSFGHALNALMCKKEKTG